MAKAKSTKLRIFITLHALTKYADKDHGLNSLTLNEYLRPYGLDCRYKFFKSTIKALREFGVDVQRKNGVWIKNRPLTDERLQLLAFALATNPYLTEEQYEEAIQGIKPFVTVYQEELLNNYVKRTPTSVHDDLLYRNCSIIQKALLGNAQIKFTNIETERNGKKKYTLFSPQSIYRDNTGLYVFGYNCSKECDEKLDLNTITNIKLVKPKNNTNDI